MGRDQKIGQVAGLIAAAVTGTVPFVLAGTLAGRLNRQAHGSRNYAQVHQGLEDGITARYIRLVVLGSTDPQ